MNGNETHKMRVVLDDLLATESLSRDIATLIGRCNQPNVPAFERYAGMVLRDAGGRRLHGTPAAASLKLIMPGRGKMVRIGYPHGCEDMLGVSDLENAINRLVGIGVAVEDGRTEEPDEQGQRPAVLAHSACNIIGSRGITFGPDHRNSHVLLPRIGALDHATVAYFNEVDWRSIDAIASNVRTIFQTCLYLNDRLKVREVEARPSGDWDMRTRLAWILENLELPFRFTYRFDCNAHTKTACVLFAAPRAASFPALVLNEETGKLEPTAERAEQAARAYAHRLAIVMAGACFGAGKHVERAVVIVQGDDIVPFTCTFSRRNFSRHTMTDQVLNRIAQPDLRFDPIRLARIAQPDSIVYRLADGDVEALASELFGDVRIEPWRDERELPEAMQALFRARRVCDIDTSHYLGGNASVIDEAKADSKDAELAAIIYLEGVVDQAERELTAPEDYADARPLFCDHAASRLAVALLDEQVNVSAEAEAFLETGKADYSATNDDLRFFRAPDALFHAHVGLSDLYQRMGNLRAAEAEANRCIALGPTCAISYLRKADALIGQHRRVEAANVLIEGLHYAIDEGDCAVLYHELALIFWTLHMRRESTALNVYAASLSGPYAEKAAQVVKVLRSAETDAQAVGAEAETETQTTTTSNTHTSTGAHSVPASPREASLVIASLGIPVMPGKVASKLIARATLGLADADAPCAAAPYAEMLAKKLKDDHATLAACRSLQFGIDG